MASKLLFQNVLLFGICSLLHNLFPSLKILIQTAFTNLNVCKWSTWGVVNARPLTVVELQVPKSISKFWQPHKWCPEANGWWNQPQLKGQALPHSNVRCNPVQIKATIYRIWGLKIVLKTPYRDEVFSCNLKSKTENANLLHCLRGFLKLHGMLQ